MVEMTPKTPTMPKTKKGISKSPMKKGSAPSNVLRRTSSQVRMANMSPMLRRASDPKFMGMTSYKQQMMEEEDMI
tara:strand:- start:165 stop:389 length:225 start_codon:yes stop_codon:yes gene_type:complete